MKNFIRSIWNDYCTMTQSDDRSSMQMKALKQLKAIHEEKLLSFLNEDAHRAFWDYEECENELNCACLENAFMEGTRFAIRFLIEALK